MSPGNKLAYLINEARVPRLVAWVTTVQLFSVFAIGREGADYTSQRSDFGNQARVHVNCRHGSRMDL